MLIDNSSVISEINYDEQEKTLSVRFKTTDETFNYFEVEPKVYKDLIESKSRGSFFHKNIRDNYDNDYGAYN